MTAQPFDATNDPEQVAAFWATEDIRPPLHHRSVCICPDPAILLDPDAVHDAVWDEDEDVPR
jgi:hypothetical protein